MHGLQQLQDQVCVSCKEALEVTMAGQSKTCSGVRVGYQDNICN